MWRDFSAGRSDASTSVDACRCPSTPAPSPSIKKIKAETYKLGRWLQDDPDFWVHDNLIAQVDKSTVDGTAQSALERAAVSDPDIARYLAGLRHTRDLPNDNAGRRDVAEYSGAQILAHLDSHPGDPCHWLRGWGMHADADERDVVFQALLLSEEPERVERLLRCFGKSGVPRFDKRLLQWTTSADEMLRWAAIRAVTSIRHEELRESALQLLANDDIANGIRLLVANFEHGDYAMCVKHLERQIDDADERHHLGLEVLGCVRLTLESMPLIAFFMSTNFRRVRPAARIP